MQLVIESCAELVAPGLRPTLCPKAMHGSRSLQRGLNSTGRARPMLAKLINFGAIMFPCVLMSIVEVDRSVRDRKGGLVGGEEG